jgi:hypothetical protein
MRLLITALTCAALCTGGPVHSREVGDPTIYEGLQVGVGRCIFVTPRSDASKSRLLQALATAAITKGVNLLGAALTKLGSAKTWKEQQGRNFQASASDFPECVQLARGRFYKGSASVAALGSSLSAKVPELRFNGLYLAGDPDFFIEMRVVAAGDGSALALRPVKTIYSKPMGKRALRGSDRSVAVFLAITAPGTSPILETAPAATIVLGSQQVGTEIDYVDPVDVSSPFESSWFTLKREDARKPLTITALVTETQDKDEFLSFVGGLLSEDSVKTDLGKAIQTVLIAPVREEQDRTEATAARTAESLANERFGAVLTELLACRSAVGPAAPTSAIAAKNALLAFLTADRDPKLTRPRNLVTQGQIDEIDPGRPAEAVQRCGALYDQLVR